MLLEDLPSFALWAVVALVATVPLLRFLTGFFATIALSRLRFEAVFFGIVFLALLAARYSILVYPNELNIDESQFVAQAHGYTRSWVPFSQDGHTCGPLNYYILIWPAALGLPITYFTIRLTGFVFILLTLFYVRRAVALISGNKTSYLILLPLVSFYLFAYQNGFVHYSSEHFPDMLLAVSIWLIAKFWRLGRSHFFLLGTILGAIPFTKLQASPLAVYLFVLAAGLIFFQDRASRSWVKSLLLLAIGGAVVPLIITVPLLATGTLSDAIHRYIIIPSRYGAGIMTPDLIPLPTLVVHLAFDGPQFTVYFIEMLACTVLGLVLLAWGGVREGFRTWLMGLVVTTIYLLLTISAVLKPDLPYAHYLLLLPQPALFLVAWIWRGCRLFCPGAILQKHQPVMTLLFLLISFFALPVYVFAQYKAPRPPGVATLDPVSTYIKTVATPRDLMANWGYSPKYYVETNVAPGVRDFATLYEIFPDKSYDYYRETYLDDLKRNMPKVIVDSVGEFYLATWPRPLEVARATHYPPLAEFLAENYQPAVEIMTHPDHPPVLVYVRK